ncbi:MAG: hypothetical protein VYD64_06325 [Pseudomonadota bacterium]|nr:hypothetical protein [Pseudomonadota bacterium]
MKHLPTLPILVSVAAIASICLADLALAARPDTRAYTCAQGRGAVAQYGSIVMTTGPHTFARIVHNRGFCGPGQDTVLKVVPTLDNPRCRIGYTCSDSIIFNN